MTQVPALQIDNLVMDVVHSGGASRILDQVTLQIAPGEIVGLVGESGSGKSMTAYAIGRLLPPVCQIVSGSIRVAGNDIAALTDRSLQALRGAEIAYIFQEPMTALAPTRRVGKQLVDVLIRHTGLTHTAARDRAIALLADVHITDPARVFAAWPHELSGGMRQRILIAMAFSCEPTLIVADEPTTALDVTVQAQVLALLKQLARQKGTAVLLISHDMGVIRQICQRLYVMHRGRIVEQADTETVIQAPRHPYTQRLLSCLPERMTLVTEKRT